MHGVSTIVRKVVVLNPSGADGSASATVNVPLGSKAGVLKAISVDYTNQTTGTLTIKDTALSKTLFTAASNATDIGVTIPTPLVSDGVDQANSALTKNTAGKAFAPRTMLEVKGVSFNNSVQSGTLGSGAKSIVVTLWIEYANLHYKTVTLLPTGANGSAAATFDYYPVRDGGCGVLRYLHIDYGTTVPSTTDILIKDRLTGNTLFTATNTATDIGPCSVSSDGVSEANAGVTKPACGLFFQRGLRLTVAQADLATLATVATKGIVVRYWIEQ